MKKLHIFGSIVFFGFTMSSLTAQTLEEYIHDIRNWIDAPHQRNQIQSLEVMALSKADTKQTSVEFDLHAKPPILFEDPSNQKKGFVVTQKPDAFHELLDAPGPGYRTIKDRSNKALQ